MRYPLGSVTKEVCKDLYFPSIAPITITCIGVGAAGYFSPSLLRIASVV